MEQKKNMIAVSYELHDSGTADNALIEKTEEGRPFVFMSNSNMVLDDFERAIAPLKKGDNFDFTLTPDRAYGEYVAERVIDLDKQLFFVDGKFDDEHIKVGGVVPLQNDNGDRFMGSVVEIGDDKVKIDLNHPLAGKSLHFTGSVLENRPATEEELKQLEQMMKGGCGGGCSDCEGCGGEGNCEGGGCGGDHHEGGGHCEGHHHGGHCKKH
ncbi:MAG: FKBP-type peptidyl-prolyl cis-trans isomerase [Prevotella sp.]|jgi:FKBP-type peptidyl-prolyl cis-trans isomerase SlyD